MACARCPTFLCGAILDIGTNGFGGVVARCASCERVKKGRCSLGCGRPLPLPLGRNRRYCTMCAAVQAHGKHLNSKKRSRLADPEAWNAKRREAYARNPEPIRQAARERRLAQKRKLGAESRAKERELLGPILCHACHLVPIPRRTGKGAQRTYCVVCEAKRRRRLQAAARKRYSEKRRTTVVNRVPAKRKRAA